MADVIENRVVELGFDNRNFEQNARTSISTLGKLDEALQFKGIASGFRSIQNGLRYLDFSPITTGLASVRDSFTNIGAAIKVNFFDMLGNEVVNLGRSIVNNTIGQIKSGGFSRALNIEQAQFKVKGLKGDWEKVYEDMDYAVSGTAYGIDEAASAASQFLASGVETGENMKAALRGISGIAAMASTDYSSIADIFTAAAGKGKVQAMELQRIALHGINATAELAKQMGKTEEEIRDMASKGEIDFNTFAKAMDTAFGEHAKKANETYTGSLSNVRAALSRIGEIWYEPWIHGLIPIFNELRLSIDKFKNALKTPMNETGDTIATQLKTLMETGSKLVVFAIETLNPYLDKLPYKFEPIFKQMQQITDKTKELSDILEAFHKQQKTKNPFDPIARAAKEAGDKVKETKDITYEEKLAAEALAKGNKYNGYKTYEEYQKAGLSYLTIRDLAKKLNKEKEKNKVLTKEEREEQERLSEITKKYSKEIEILNRAYEIFGKLGNVANLIFEKLSKVFKIAGDAWKLVFPREDLTLFETIINYVTNIIKKFEISGERAELLRTIFLGLFHGLDLVKMLFKDILTFIEPFIRTAAAGHPVFLSWLADIAKFITGLRDYRLAMGEYPPLLQSFLDMGQMVVRGIRLVWQKLVKVLTAVKEAFQEVWAEFRPENSRFPDLITSWVDLIKQFKIAGPRAKAIKEIFKGLFAAMHAGFVILKEFKEFTEMIFSSIFGVEQNDQNKDPVILQVLAKVSEWLHQLSLDIKDVAEKGNLFDVVKLILDRLATSIMNLFSKGENKKDGKTFTGFFDGLKDTIKGGIEKAVNWLKENKPLEWVFSLFDGIDLTGIFGNIFNAIGDFFKWLSDSLKDEDSLLFRFISTIADILGMGADILKDQVGNIGVLLNDIFDFLHNFFNDNPDMAEHAGDFLIALMDHLVVVLQVASETLVAIKEPLVESSKAIVEILGALGGLLEKWINFAGDNPEKTFDIASFFVIVWLIKQILVFLKTTEFTTFGFALRRIYNSISMFFQNLSSIAFRGAQLMWAKEVETIANAIIKIAIALAIIGVTVGYHSDNYSGLNAGLAILVISLTALLGFYYLAEDMGNIMALGVAKMWMFGFVMGEIAGAVILMALAFAIIAKSISKVNAAGALMAFFTFMLAIGGLIAILNELMLILPAINAMQIPAILTLAGFLVIFSGAVVLMAVSFGLVMNSMRLLYHATGKSTGETIGIAVVAAVVVLALTIVMTTMVKALAVIKTIPWAGLISLIVMAGVMTGIMSVFGLILVAISKIDSEVAWGSVGRFAVLWAIGVATVAALIFGMIYIASIAKMLEGIPKVNLIITFAAIVILLGEFMGLMVELSTITLAMKFVNQDAINKVGELMFGVALLFIMAAGAVVIMTAVAKEDMFSTDSKILIAATAIIFLLLSNAMKDIAQVAILMKAITTVDTLVLGDLLWSVVILFGVAIGAVAAMTVLSKKNAITGKIGILLALGSVAAVYKAMLNTMKALVNMAILMKMSGITIDTIKKMGKILTEMVTVLAIIAVVMTAVGWMIGGSAAEVALGVAVVCGVFIALGITLYFVAGAITSIANALLNWAKAWPDIRDNWETFINDMAVAIPDAITVICKSIIIGIPTILATIYIVFLAINAFLALIMPAQAAMFLLGINAMLDVILVGADAIIIKLFILLDILLWALDSQAEVIGYELVMIILKALGGAVEALYDFFEDFGKSMAEDFWLAYNNSWLGSLAEWLSDFFMWWDKNVWGGELFTRFIQEDPDKVGDYIQSLYKDNLFAHEAGKNKWTITAEGDVQLDVDESEVKKKVKNGRDTVNKAIEDEEKNERTFTINSNAVAARADEARNSYTGETNEEILDKLQKTGAVDEQQISMYKEMEESRDKWAESWKKAGDEVGDTFGGASLDSITNFIKDPANSSKVTEAITGVLTNMDFLGDIKSAGANVMNTFSDGMKEGFSGKSLFGLIGLDPENMTKGFDSSKLAEGVKDITNQYNPEDWIKFDASSYNTKDMNKLMSGIQGWGKGDIDMTNPFDSNAMMEQWMNSDNITNKDEWYKSMQEQLGFNFDQNIDVDAVDPLKEQLILALQESNMRINELNRKVEASVIIPKDAKINITTEIDGDKVAAKTFRTISILQADEEAMRNRNISTGAWRTGSRKR